MNDQMMTDKELTMAFSIMILFLLVWIVKIIAGGKE